MSAKFTPGPWRLDVNLYQATIWGKTAKGDMKIADLRGWGHLTGVGGLRLSGEQAAEIQDATGHLIAAAPDLYEALKAMLEADAYADAEGIVTFSSSDTESGQKALALARAALAKAEARK
ncbi:MAG: hypothetical protein KGL39_60755 [Patescibacteria group bacterium]|nr:hypothetical protein [Patescibacteria group bacterium]